MGEGVYFRGREKVEKKIYKYRLDVETKLELPIGSKILSVKSQNGVIFLWAIVDTDVLNLDREVRTFIILGTGHTVPNLSLCFIDTCIIGDFVWHVFEVL